MMDDTKRATLYERALRKIAEGRGILMANELSDLALGALADASGMKFLSGTTEEEMRNKVLGR
jgi:hypothetical protein